ncbi:uncharacterized protein P884DRAFT_63498 [Thermothelomyces heterothallicus CBS 202.75]|uniref:uncharacterized protein n=1 Tax=Thermothelomyces heterothallicus CBS 202.75 TaxID=1149848 RepID=UPI003744084A
MSCLRSTGHSLGKGAQCLLWRKHSVSVWTCPTSSTAEDRRIAKIRALRPMSPASRSFSAHRPLSGSGQTSRFKRPETSVVETQVGITREKTAVEPSLNTTTVSESVVTKNSTTNTASAASAPSNHQARPTANSKAQIPPRRPIDTSSKEYKEAASRYVRFVVGLPVLLVTSYYLYQRLEPQVKLRVVESASSSSQASNSGN